MRSFLLMAWIVGLALPGLGQSPSPRILLISPEQTSILQTGGLSHATTGLARALNEQGLRAEVLMPGYLQMNSGPLTETGERLTVPLDWRDGQPRKQSRFSVLRNQDPSNPTVFLRHDSLPQELNYFDNRSDGGKKFYAPEPIIGEVFGAFGKAAADYALSQKYDIVILNDWTTGLTALHLAEAKARGEAVPKVIFAIHNIAYQGLFPRSLADFLGLNPRHFSIDGYEFFDKMSFLKAGLQFSDMIYTVSSQYAKEIATPRFGAGLDGLIRRKTAEGRVTGILNGILNSEWDPVRKVPGLEFEFSAEDLRGKGRGKAAVQSEMGLPVRPDVPLFILTSRLAEQKGFEYLITAIEDVLKEGRSQWIVSGDGDARYIESLKELERRYPESFRFRPFSGLLEKQLTRYGDFFVNGAWFEPSGLNQLFSLKNGTIPVVSAAGGLLESVKDGQTGLHFKIIEGQDGIPYDRAATARSAAEAFRRAIRIHANPAQLHDMRTRAMAEDHSWTHRVRTEMRSLFSRVLERPLSHSGAPKCSTVLAN